MFQIAYIAALWLAAVVVGRKINNTMSTAPLEDQSLATGSSTDPTLETNKLKLDALEAIRDSSFQRWDKRRGYEWSLSISVWTALAAFSGLVLSKDFPFTNNDHPVVIGVGVAGALICIFHGFYLWMMFDHTIGDAYVQRWAEEQMCNVAVGRQIALEVMPFDLQHHQLGNIGLRQFILAPLWPSWREK